LPSVAQSQHDTWLPLGQHIGPIQDTWLSTSDVKRGQNLEAEASGQSYEAEAKNNYEKSTK